MIVDIRKKAAFEKGHIPGAVSFPFPKNPEAWRSKLSNIFPSNVDHEASAVVSLLRSCSAGSARIYCHTGTWRSRAFAAFAASLNIPIEIMPGGYRAFQQAREKVFDRPYPLVVVGGKTGSGKTALLEALRMRGEQVIHLEELANHKGSAFGGLQRSQPQITNEQFRNDLSEVLSAMDSRRMIWVEDEGRSLGHVGIPTTFWNQMHAAPVVKLELRFERRIQRILDEYGHIDRELLAKAVEKVQNRLGDAAATARSALLCGQLATTVNLMLNYYDESYAFHLKNRRVILTIQMDDQSMKQVALELSSRVVNVVCESYAET